MPCILSHCRFLWSDFFSALHQSHFSWWQYSDYDTRRLHPLSCLSLHFPPRTLTCEKHKKYAFFVCFRPFLGQTDNHISWVTLKPFASISPTDPRTNPAQFCKTISRNDCCEKHFFLSGPFWQFFSKIPWKAVKCSLVARMGQFFCLPWFPAHEVLGQHLWTGM